MTTNLTLRNELLESVLFGKTLAIVICIYCIVGSQIEMERILPLLELYFVLTLYMDKGYNISILNSLILIYKGHWIGLYIGVKKKSYNQWNCWIGILNLFFLLIWTQSNKVWKVCENFRWLMEMVEKDHIFNV